MKKLLLTSVFVMFLGGYSPSAKAQETLTEDQVAKWTQFAMEQIQTFGFNDIDKRKVENKKYFTDEGYNSFYTAMDKSRLPEMIKVGMMVRETKLTCFPEVKRTGDASWVAKFPLESVTFDATRRRTDYQSAALVIERHPTAKNELQLGIKQFISRGITPQEAKICGDTQRVKWEIQELKREIHEREIRIKKLEAKIKQ